MFRFRTFSDEQSRLLVNLRNIAGQAMRLERTINALPSSMLLAAGSGNNPSSIASLHKPAPP